MVAMAGAWLYISVVLFAVTHEPFALWNWTLGQVAVLALNLWVALRRPHGCVQNAVIGARQTQSSA